MLTKKTPILIHDVDVCYSIVIVERISSYKLVTTKNVALGSAFTWAIFQL